MTCVMVNILKNAARAQGVDEAVSTTPRYLKFVFNQAVCRRQWSLTQFSDDLKDQGICEWVVYKNSWQLEYVSDHFKPREVCDDVMMEDPMLQRYVPHWFVTQQQLRQCDDYYDDNGYIKWYAGYKKRKTQKAKIKNKLMPMAWHPSRWWDWFVAEDDGKKETEKLWA